MTTIMEDFSCKPHRSNSSYFNGVVLLGDRVNESAIGDILHAEVRINGDQISLTDPHLEKQDNLRRFGVSQIDSVCRRSFWQARREFLENWYLYLPGYNKSAVINEDPNYFKGFFLVRGRDLIPEVINGILGANVQITEESVNLLSGKRHLFRAFGLERLELSGNVWRISCQDLEIWREAIKSGIIIVPVVDNGSGYCPAVGKLIGYGVRVIGDRVDVVATTPEPAANFLGSHLVRDNGEVFFVVSVDELFEYQEVEVERSGHPKLTQLLGSS
jgi:hypothetical protein